MNATLNQHQVHALKQQVYVGNTALADALKKVVDGKKVVLKPFVSPISTPPTQSIVPATPVPTSKKKSLRVTVQPEASVLTPRASPAQKWNITIWTIIDDRESTKLVKHVANLLRKDEVPLFVITLKEYGVKTSLTLKGELVENDMMVKFKVIEGSGRLFDTFPKNTVFFGGELSGSMVPPLGRQEIVAKFRMEVNALLHQLDIALRSKLKNPKS